MKFEDGFLAHSNQNRLYGIWSDMKRRCLNPTRNAFKNYGGRGISFQESWNSFDAFANWAITNGYQNDLTLERCNNDGDYCESNCIWVDKATQARNRRSNIKIDYEGKEVCLAEYLESIGMQKDYVMVYKRLMRGWPLEKALNRERVYNCQLKNVEVV